jgi:hypothetical protein
MSPSMNGIELMVFVDSPEKREEDAAYICLRSSREILVARLHVSGVHDVATLCRYR